MVDAGIKRLECEIIEELDSWTRVTEKCIAPRCDFETREKYRRVIHILQAAREAIAYHVENPAQLALPFGEVA